MGETTPVGTDNAHLDAVQGDCEKRSKPYKQYGAASIAASQRSNAPKISSAGSYAGRQGDGV